MNPQEFRALLDEHPFRPMRITMTDGRTFDIVHPELAIVGRTIVTIGLIGNSADNRIVDRTIAVSLLHILRVEAVETAPKAK